MSSRVHSADTSIRLETGITALRDEMAAVRRLGGKRVHAQAEPCL